MIRDIGKAVGSTVLESLGRALGRAQEHRPLPVDLLESEEAFLAVFDAPGALAGDVQVRYEDGAIVVRIDRFRDFYEGFEMQFPGRGLSLDGRVELPADATVDPADATATLKENGTLHVRVPKTEAEPAPGGDPASEGETDVEPAGENDGESDAESGDETGESDAESGDETGE